MNPGHEVVLKEIALTAHEQTIHDVALASADKYRQAESELLNAIIQVDRSKLFRKFGCNSCFTYCTSQLRLSEAVAYNFINVARKSTEVPELKAAIDQGRLSVSRARKIVPVLNEENQAAWIDLASTVSQSKLERQVANALPDTPIQMERVKPVSRNQVNIQFNTSEEVMAIFRRAQDLVSAKQRRAATLEETFEFIAREFVTRHDPVEKAVRAKDVETKKAETKKASSEVRVSATQNLSRDKFSRKPLPAALVHAINRRDSGKCQASKAHGKCESTRWPDYHHIIPVHMGGEDTLENLITLCSACHREWHRRNDRTRESSPPELRP